MRIAQPSPFAAPGTPAPPPPVPPGRKHGGGRAKSSPEATQAVLEALDGGASIKHAAETAGVSWPTARAIWIRERGTWPPPGLGKSSNGPGRPPSKLTILQAAHAERRIKNGETVTAVAKDLKVSRQTLYRAIERLKQDGP